MPFGMYQEWGAQAFSSRVGSTCSEKSQYILSPIVHSLRLKVLEDWGNVEGCKLSYFLNVESSWPCMQNHVHEDWEVLGRHHLYGRERCEKLIGEGPSVNHHLSKEIRHFQVHGVNQASQSPCSFSVYIFLLDSVCQIFYLYMQFLPS